MSNKNIALLLPGISRSAKLCYDSLEKSILNNFNVDIFVHTYSQSNISVDENHSEYENSYNELIELLSPKEIVVEDYFEVREKLRQKLACLHKVTAIHPMRCISSFYKIEKCFELLNNHDIEKYDFFVRARMDILYEDRLNIDNINIGEIYIPKPCNKKTIFENGYYKSYSGDYMEQYVMDHFAVGDYESMMKYCKCYSNLEFLCNQRKIPLHPEWITKQNLLASKLEIKRFKFDYSLHRRPVI